MKPPHESALWSLLTSQLCGASSLTRVSSVEPPHESALWSLLTNTSQLCGTSSLTRVSSVEPPHESALWSLLTNTTLWNLLTSQLCGASSLTRVSSVEPPHESALWNLLTSQLCGASSLTRLCGTSSRVSSVEPPHESALWSLLTNTSQLCGASSLTRVDDHKTMTFGQASILLDRQEFDWLLLLAIGSFCKEECSGANFVFHSSSGAQLKHGSELINRAWSAAGLKGTITFNKVRSSVATQANDHLTEKERRRVARALCHDPATASKFYVALPIGERQYQDRLLRMKALCLASNTRPDRQTRPAVSSSSESEGPEPTASDLSQTASALSQTASALSQTASALSPKPCWGSGLGSLDGSPKDPSNPEQEPEPEVDILSPEYEPLTPPHPSTADRQPWTPVWDLDSPVPALRKRRRMLFPADEEDEEPRALPQDMPPIKECKVDVDRLPSRVLLYYATVIRKYPA
uniref:Uncharacterized protein n=1 Tax=Knipowitschia caucasica TaxID=637954 RepID=A0AAV2J926_KNICA